MNSVRYLIIVSIFCLRSLAGEAEFYRQFLSVTGTNNTQQIRITSPLLVDTNNTTPKLAAVNLNDLKTNSELSGIRLGMTMQEVVTRWGKPRDFWSNCFGGPRFVYADMSVIFEPGKDSVMSLYCYDPRLPALEGGLSSSSTVGDFIGVLGKPTRTERDSYEFLVYEASHSILRIGFNGEKLYSIRLTRGTGGAQ